MDGDAVGDEVGEGMVPMGGVSGWEHDGDAIESLREEDDGSMGGVVLRNAVTVECLSSLGSVLRDGIEGTLLRDGDGRLLALKLAFASVTGALIPGRCWSTFAFGTMHGGSVGIGAPDGRRRDWRDTEWVRVGELCRGDAAEIDEEQERLGDDAGERRRLIVGGVELQLDGPGGSCRSRKERVEEAIKLGEA